MADYFQSGRKPQPRFVVEREGADGMAWLGVWRRLRQGDGGVAPRRAGATTNSVGAAADGPPRERGREEVANRASLL